MGTRSSYPDMWMTISGNFVAFCSSCCPSSCFLFFYIFAPQYKAASWHARSDPNSGYHDVARKQSQIVGIKNTPLVLTSALCKSYQIWNQFIIQPCVHSYLSARHAAKIQRRPTWNNFRFPPNTSRKDQKKNRTATRKMFQTMWKKTTNTKINLARCWVQNVQN